MRRSVKYGLYGAVRGRTRRRHSRLRHVGRRQRRSPWWSTARARRSRPPRPARERRAEGRRLPRRAATTSSRRAAVAPEERHQDRVQARPAAAPQRRRPEPRTCGRPSPTVAAALEALGYPAADFVSVSRSKRLPLGATSIALRTPKQVTVVADKHTVHSITTDPDRGAGPEGPRHRRRPARPRDAGPDHAGHRRAWRCASSASSSSASPSTSAVPFSVVQHSDSSMYRDQTKVLKHGQDGSAELIYNVVYVDGKATGRTLVSAVVVAQPRTQGREGRHQEAAEAEGAEGVEQRAELGRGRQLRVRRQLAHQHRQRLLRRPAVRHRHLALQRRRRLRSRAPTSPAASSRSRSPPGCTTSAGPARGRSAARTSKLHRPTALRAAAAPPLTVAAEALSARRYGLGFRSGRASVTVS